MVAVLAIAMLFLAPFALMVLGGVGVLLLVALWLKAAIRARRLAGPFGPIEGAIALSSLLMVVGAAAVSGWMVARLGLGQAVSLGGAMLPGVASSGGRQVGWRSVWYSNAETQQRLKDDLAKAGIPFKTRMEGGKEYVSWPPEHDAAADRIQEQARNADQPRGIHFGSSDMQKEFVAWLAKRRIKSDIVVRDGQEYVTWDDPAEPKVMMDAFIAARPSKCPKQKAKC